MGVESLSLGGDEDVPGGQQRAASVAETAMGEPLGLGYGALRRREIASGEGRMPSVFEAGQSSGSVPEFERPEIVTTYSDTTITEWSPGSLPISPVPFIVPSHISSPMISLTVPSLVALPATTETEGFLTELGARVEMQGGLIHDHTVRLEELSLALFKRSLEHEHERVVVTFGAIWRPVLALESWAEERRAQLELAEIVDGMRRG
ncbi:hypothetical protein Tco_0632957 [Tanacetum coccineum]